MQWHPLTLLPLSPCDGITFPKHDSCVDEKCILTIECQGLDGVHRRRTTVVLEDSNVIALILATVGSRE